MSVLRTPQERFFALEGFDFEPHYIEINGVRVHYVDVGSGEIVLCLHGEPTWSYLYRKMIPSLSAHHRVIAMDFIGFGKSDKFAKQTDYSYRMHRDTLIEFIRKLELNRITLVVQDWGGLIGLRVATMMPDCFERLVIMNTGLPTGKEKLPLALQLWRLFVRLVPSLPIGLIVRSFGTVQPLSKEVIKAYEAPFPSRHYKQGAKAWPLLIPTNPTSEAALEIKEARRDLSVWHKPTLVMFSDRDPFTRGADKFFRRIIPTAKNQPKITIKEAGHFLQEDKGEEIAQQILEFVIRTPR